MNKLWNILILLAVILVGCNETDDLWDEVHDLQKRLTKLEVQVNNINGNVTALQELYKNGATITKVEEKDGTYILTLSNGKVLKVVQKMEETIFPIVGINAEGYWTVRYGNAEPVSLGIKALGENGKTPQFRINEAGYWEVRYSDTEEWSSNLGPNGTPVKAEGTSSAGSEQYFDAVKVSADGTTFDMVLKDGTKLSVPIVSNFSCTFEEGVTGIQTFGSKDTKTFKVLLNGVDYITLMAAPAGWEVKLSEPENNAAILTVTAPEAITTPTVRATAQSGTDISILANAGKFATILKLQVAVIAKEPVKDNYSMYTEGTLEVGGIQINTTNYPNGVILDDSQTDLSTALKNLTANTVFFLSGNTVFTTGAAIVSLKDKEIVFISKQPSESPTLNVGNEIRLQDNGSLVLKNINITVGTSLTGQTLISNTGTSATITPKGFYCENCHFKGLAKKILFLNAATHKINTIYFKSNKVEATADAITFFSTYNVGANSNSINDVTIDNNTWWYRQGGLAKGYIYNHSNASAKTLNLSFSNNTIINIAPQSTAANNAAYIVLDSTEGLAINDNIAYCEDTSAPNIGNSGSSFYRTGQADLAVTISGNIVYGLLPTIKWNSYVFNSATKVAQEKGQEIIRYSQEPIAIKDFINGIFTPISELTGKGSNLN